MSKPKLKVEVKTGSSGPKIAEARPKVEMKTATEKPAAKPIYRSRAKLTAHITINGKRRS